MMQVKIRMLKTVSFFSSGAVYSVPADLANFLIAKGYATHDLTGPTETKPTGPTETKHAKHKSR
jgi:hypothetical protein